MAHALRICPALGRAPVRADRHRGAVPCELGPQRCSSCVGWSCRSARARNSAGLRQSCSRGGLSRGFPAWAFPLSNAVRSLALPCPRKGSRGAFSPRRSLSPTRFTAGSLGRRRTLGAGAAAAGRRRGTTPPPPSSLISGPPAVSQSQNWCMSARDLLGFAWRLPHVPMTLNRPNPAGPPRRSDH